MEKTLKHQIEEYPMRLEEAISRCLKLQDSAAEGIEGICIFFPSQGISAYSLKASSTVDEELLF